MLDECIKVGDCVIVDEKVILSMLPANATTAAHRGALKKRYSVTGIGPTCYGVRADDEKKGFNVPHDKVIRMARKSQPKQRTKFFQGVMKSLRQRFAELLLRAHTAVKD